MKLELVMKTARSVTLRAMDGGIYTTKGSYKVILNGEEVMQTKNVIFSLYHLKPAITYEVVLEEESSKEIHTICFTTDDEFVTLNVREMGATGDGVTDDTSFIQAAISACPPRGRVLIPAGDYRIISLFLKSHTSIELQKGARLIADTNPLVRPILPGMIESYDEKEEYNLGTWEGNPLNMYAGVIHGMDVCDITIYGEGCIDGGASIENWWKNPKNILPACRPRLIFLNRCSEIRMQGLQLKNSPSWTVHPYFSTDLIFTDLTIRNPKDSPNTDGIDPESCSRVQIEGVHFDLGDDCIAIKSGKIYMGKTYHTPSQGIHIRQCLMENGHGAVTIGSEMAGGVKDVEVDSCYFHNTDRGLRIKTRRGRGEAGVIDDIVFQNVIMEEVLTPIVVNCFYFCDPDGRSDYVQSRELHFVDERTPGIGKLKFEHIICRDCHFAAVYVEGLPEQKISEISLNDVHFTYAKDAKEGYPAMSLGVEKYSKYGCYLNNVRKVDMNEVTVEGCVGEPYHYIGVEEVNTNERE